jgi:predicted MFS family arabinose efflux permease
MDVSEEQAAPAAAVRRGTITVMSAACGIMVGNVYLCQPLLHEIAVGFGVTEQAAGLVAVAAQIGFATGILMIVPLADVAEPRRLVRVLMAVTAVGLFAAAAAPGLPVLIVATILASSATVVPQVLIPLATGLAAPEQRGRIIGTLQTGLVLGILLSRTVAGLVASAAGTWRAAYALAAVLTGCLFMVLPAFMPARLSGRERQSYPALLRSMPPLLVHRALRLSMGLGFCIFGAFSAFWATLAFHLATPAFGLGPAATGLFGLWGAPGAMVAPLGGRLADRFGAGRVNLAALLSAGGAFVVAAVIGGSSLLALVVTVNLLDFGLQSGQVANQVRIFALSSHLRARLNTLYMVAVFSGGAVGSFVGTMAWSGAGWIGVCAVGIGFVAMAGVFLARSKAR